MKKYFAIFLCVLTFTLGASHVLAVAPPNDPISSGCTAEASKGEYCLLAPIPQLETTPGSGIANFTSFIPNAIKLVIGLATGIAVLMVIWGGFEYILSAVPNVKANGRKRISDALLGLLFLSISWTLLYTLNPKLVKFSLNLDYVGSSAPIDTSGPSTTTPTNPPDPSTPTNPSTPGSGSGVLPGTNNCGTNCAESQSFKFPQKGSGGGACLGSTCYVNPTLGKELEALNQNLGNTGSGANKFAWIVTEMVPPTVKHNDSCHGDGTCVDASVTDRSVSNLVKFFTAVEQSGISSYEYEICDQSRLAQFQSDPNFKNLKVKFKCETTTTGESAHLNL